MIEKDFSLEKDSSRSQFRQEETPFTRYEVFIKLLFLLLFFSYCLLYFKSNVLYVVINENP